MSKTPGSALIQTLPYGTDQHGSPMIAVPLDAPPMRAAQVAQAMP